MAISMLKIRRPLGRLIFNMGIAIPGKTVFLIETAPWCRVGLLKNHCYTETPKILDTNDLSLLCDDLFETYPYLYVPSGKTHIDNAVWLGITCGWTSAPKYISCYNLAMECAIYTSIKHLNMKPCVNEKTHWALIIDCVIISTDIYV